MFAVIALFIIPVLVVMLRHVVHCTSKMEILDIIKEYAFTIFEDILFIEHTFYDNVYSKQWVILVNLNCINYQLLLFKRRSL